MDSGLTVVSDPVVTLRITSTISPFETEKRFMRSITIAEFKGKLEIIVGSPASCMNLALFSTDDKFLQKMDDNDALLGSYHVDNYCKIHVTDTSGQQVDEYNDVSKVQKVEISDDAYEKRTDSARSFMKTRKLGHFNEEDMAKKKAELAAQTEEQKAAADAISVGSRCKVQVVGQPSKLGTVMYVGTTLFKPGYWVGVKYDEPLGKNNGTVDGKQYFECENKYGAFVKPLNVTVGDFPEEDYGLDEM
ncbi:tubulin-folding cofactor B [Takifugu rubripes]|uniref:tubulin-folding cofactor B n=1 Tax=Takifugu rubripes TaxID=31033 RepID=UPI00016E96C7|nr:tubulin-folding cofactor B [Takifugu rubripes]|eukprot:XP_003968404.1 PREDICTED: tubulin-folding cofactor B [Takifugu rubripes]